MNASLVRHLPGNGGFLDFKGASMCNSPTAIASTAIASTSIASVKGASTSIASTKGASTKGASNKGASKKNIPSRKKSVMKKKKKRWWSRFLDLFKRKEKKRHSSQDTYSLPNPSTYKTKEELRTLRRLTYSTINLPSNGRGSVSKRASLDGFHSDVEVHSFE